MEIESNSEQEHKAIANTRYLFRGSSHRSTPRLHLREGFPLSTEDFTMVYQRPEYRTLPLTKISTKEISPQEEHKEQVTK